MKHFLLILLAVLLIIPASAQTVTYTAPSQQAVWSIDIDSPPGTTGDITLNLADGSTVTGSWSYNFGLTGMTANTQIGSDSGSFGTIIPTNLKIRVWNGDNVTYARQIKMGAGQVVPIWNTVVQTTIQGLPITGYTINADQQISVDNELIAYSEAVSKLNAGVPTDAIAQLFEYMSLLWIVFDSLWYWLSFLFIENLTLTVSLYAVSYTHLTLPTNREV